MGLGTVSIHALLAESDQPDSGANQKHDVSIHALLAESDGPRGGGGRRSHRFNPRPPCGERLFPMTPTALSCCFNPRPPCGERPCPPWMTSCSLTVSIHALLAESDSNSIIPLPLGNGFNPRPPCGERLPQRYMLLINHASGALRQLHEDGTSHTVFSSSYLVVNLRFPMSYKNRRLPGNLM